MAGQKYPCGLAYITDIEKRASDDADGESQCVQVFGTVGWYARCGWSTKNFPAKKNAGYSKYFINEEGEDGRNEEKWVQEKDFCLTECVVPIAVPKKAKAPPNVSFEASFMAKVAKACIEFGVVND